jgi:hypothetical protein
VIEIEPVRVPVAVGVKVTLNVQLAPAPSELPQVLPVSEKSPVAAPTESVVDSVLVFFTVTPWPALVVPSSCEANVKAAGVTVTVTVGAPVPVPERVTVCGEFVALSVIDIVPGSDPFAVGVNDTVMVQLVPTCNRVPQLFIWL